MLRDYQQKARRFLDAARGAGSQPALPEFLNGFRAVDRETRALAVGQVGNLPHAPAAARHVVLALLALAFAASAAVVIDRIAVIVGKHVVKLSDVDRDLRVTDLLNGQPLAGNAAEKRKSAERLVDQQIIRDELATGGYARASDADAEAMLQQIRQKRYGGSEVRMKQALSVYGLTEEQLRAQLLWQLTVLRFIDQRFRPGVLVTDEEVRAYYDQHAELRKAAFETAAPQIRTTLEGEQVNTQFESWLEGSRRRERIEFREAAFQ